VTNVIMSATDHRLAANTLAEALAQPGRVIISAELSPSARHPDRLFRFAEAARRTDVVVTLTDAPAGLPAPSPDPFAVELAQQMGRQPIVTVSCRGATQAALLARLDALHRAGLRNVLVVTGDYPRQGNAVFETDSAGLLLEAGRLGASRGATLNGQADAAHDFCFGTAVSPFKYTEGDIWGQRIKTWKKRRAGASFLITQIGFDIAKFQELRLWMKRDGMSDVPVLASVHMLHAGNADTISNGRLPGVFVSPDLAALIAGEAPGGRARARRRSALLADVLVRGLGYRGIHFGGLSTFDDLAEIRSTMDELRAHSWRESYDEYICQTVDDRRVRFAPEGGFTLFPRGADGLLRDAGVQAANRSRYASPPRWLTWAHRLFFSPGNPGTWWLRQALTRAELRGLTRLLEVFEHEVKGRTLGCQMCGDCRIADLQYRCPEPARGCFKSLLNGPCGGATVDGRCEVDPARPCYWRLVVESALATGTLAQLYQAQTPRDPALRGTSSWRNFALGQAASPLAIGQPAWLAATEPAAQGAEGGPISREGR
jgi:methylenetetrahydrofolate reductase (NADPH)